VNGEHDLFSEVQKQTDTDWLRHFLHRIDSPDSLEGLSQLLPARASEIEATG
jgi:hypothetical protein